MTENPLEMTLFTIFYHNGIKKLSSKKARVIFSQSFSTLFFLLFLDIKSAIFNNKDVSQNPFLDLMRE